MIELPNELVIALGTLIGMLVAEGLQSLSRLLGKDLSGQAAAITAAIVTLLVAVVNGAMIHIPAEYLPYARALLGALVILLGPAGIHSVLKKAK